MTDTQTAETGMTKRDRWIPWYIVGFFAIIFVMDGIFVYLATNTHTGVVTEQAYLKGLNYNETVAAAEAQSRLGWTGTVDYADNGEFTYTLTAQGQPLSGADIVAEFTRPTHNGVDFTVPLLESDTGAYRAAVDFPLDGVWDVRVYVTWNQQQYQQADRLIVR